MTAGAGWFALVCVGVLAVGWVLSIPPLRDAGGYHETLKTFLAELAIWRNPKGFHHAFWHVVGSAITFAVGVALGAELWAAAVITFLAWTVVEVAQRYPSVPYTTKEHGRFSVWDLLADAIGIAIAWAVIAVMR